MYPNPPNPPIICPKCNTQNPSRTQFCQMCGEPLAQNQTWPPLPPPFQERASDDKLLFKSATADRVVGAISTFMSGFLIPFFFIGLGILVYLFAKYDTYKSFKQGMQIGCGIWLVLLLGAFVTCFYAFSHESH